MEQNQLADPLANKGRRIVGPKTTRVEHQNALHGKATLIKAQNLDLSVSGFRDGLAKQSNQSWTDDGHCAQAFHSLSVDFDFDVVVQLREPDITIAAEMAITAMLPALSSRCAWASTIRRSMVRIPEQTSAGRLTMCTEYQSLPWCSKRDPWLPLRIPLRDVTRRNRFHERCAEARVRETHQTEFDSCLPETRQLRIQPCCSQYGTACRSI